MKLAEALMLRSDLQTKLQQLKERVENNAKIQEGDIVSEDPEKLLIEIESVIDEINGLVKKINATNSITILDDGRTLTEALADRDSIMLKRKTLSSILEKAVIKNDRYTRTEIKYINTINILQLQKQIDRLSTQFRVLDTQIQEKNWLVQLNS